MTIPTDIVSHRDQLDQTIVDKIKNILITMNKDSKGVNILRNFDNETKFEEMKNIKQVLNNLVQMVS
jgi:ABC-type phosphate/phosphonate transport system substrate-binding protein